MIWSLFQKEPYMLRTVPRWILLDHLPTIQIRGGDRLESPMEVMIMAGVGQVILKIIIKIKPDQGLIVQELVKGNQTSSSCISIILPTGLKIKFLTPGNHGYWNKIFPILCPWVYFQALGSAAC